LGCRRSPIRVPTDVGDESISQGQNLVDALLPRKPLSHRTLDLEVDEDGLGAGDRLDYL
jgi:hypothetical protein